MRGSKVLISLSLLLFCAQAWPISAQQSPYNVPGRKVLRVSLLCRDIESTSKLWAQILGVPAPQVTNVKAQSRSPLDFHSTAPHAQFRRAFLSIGGTPVEFLQPIGRIGSPEADFVRSHSAGVNRILFGTIDSTAIDRFTKLGLTKRIQAGRTIYVYSADKLGVLTEWIAVKDQKSLDALGMLNSPAEGFQPGAYPELRTLIQIALVTGDFRGLNERWAQILGEAGPELPTNPAGHWLLRGQPTKAYNEATRAFPFGNLVIEILHVVNREGGSLMTEFQDQRGEGVQHFCFSVANIDSVVAHFHEFGLSEGMASVQPGTTSQRNSKGSHFIESLEKLGVDVELLSSN